MRKRRTREHVIADLSVNHVERFVLRAGHTAERVYRDYGYDLLMFTCNGDGEIEDNFVAIQLKATDSVRFVAGGSELALTVERRDWDYWLTGINPVILILFDAQDDRAYWLRVQNLMGLVPQSATSQTVTLRFQKQQVVNEAAVMEWQRIKNNVVAQKGQSYDQKS